MSRGTRLPRAAAAAVLLVGALLVGALLAGGLTAAVASAKPAPDPALDDAIVAQPFAADSRDACGVTKGQLGWHLGSLTVDVKGTVADNPACGGVLYSTIATFTALAPNGVTRRVTQPVDDGQRAFSFSFPGPVKSVDV
jgi:hypothetical protein